MLSFETQETMMLIDGPAGQLEVMTLAPAHAKNAIAFICHPHPLYQGTMRNKVVFTIAKAFDDLGVKTVRFNYRGVGQSEGDYGEGLGETEDLLALVNLAKKEYPDHVMYLAGFSFGTFVATKACNELPEVKGLLTVAPSMVHFDFSSFNDIHCPWLIIQGTADEVISMPAVFDFAKSNADRVELQVFDGVGHFFHGELTRLREAIKHYFEPKVNAL